MRPPRDCSAIVSKQRHLHVLRLFFKRNPEFSADFGDIDFKSVFIQKNARANVSNLIRS